MGSLRRARLVAAMSALLLGCGGFGGGGGAGGGSGGAIRAIDACGLLTEAEIEGAIGKQVGPGVQSGLTGNAAGCEWVGVNQEDAVTVSLTLTEFDQALWDIQARGDGVEPVSGLGDAALRGWVTDDLLTIRKGNVVIDFAAISVYADADAVHDAQEELARKLLSRL